MQRVVRLRSQPDRCYSPVCQHRHLNPRVPEANELILGARLNVLASICTGLDMELLTTYTAAISTATSFAASAAFALSPQDSSLWCQAHTGCNTWSQRLATHTAARPAFGSTDSLSLTHGCHSGRRHTSYVLGMPHIRYFVSFQETPYNWPGSPDSGRGD
jgi:hypothetical protein